MAFIVPVVRKDFTLYQQRKSDALSKNGRSNSTPIRVVSVESLERSLARQAYHAKRSRQSSASVSAPESPASVERRRCSRRISIRHFNSESTDSTTSNTSSKRRVRFGHCEEIEFVSEEDEDEDQPRIVPHRPTKRTSVPNEKFSTKGQQGARPRSVSLMELEPANLEAKISTLSTILRLAKLANPGN